MRSVPGRLRRWSSAGTWTLNAEDDAGGDTGTIVDWELITDPPIGGVCETCDDPGLAPAVPVVEIPTLAPFGWRFSFAGLARCGDHGPAAPAPLAAPRSLDARARRSACPRFFPFHFAAGRGLRHHAPPAMTEPRPSGARFVALGILLSARSSAWCGRR